MLDRIVALIALSLTVVVGSLFVAAQYSAAESPPAVAQAGQATTPVPQPVPPPIAPPAVNSVRCSGCAEPPRPPYPLPQNKRPPPSSPRRRRKTPAPVVSAPPAQEPAQEPAPVATAPAESPLAPAPVVSAPLPPEKPALSMKDKIKGVAAKFLFAAEKLPTIGKAMAIGYYPRGCLQGGVELPVDGPNWQVMRLSRNRNWGHPELVNFLENFAPLAAKATGWNGVLVGDMAQPRGGPLPFGHMSHQIGLDVDIWFMPMPDHRLSKEERENISATNLVADDWKHVNPKTWTPARYRLHPHRRGAARGRARAGQCRDQEGTLPRRRQEEASTGWTRCAPGTATTTTSMCG